MTNDNHLMAYCRICLKKTLKNHPFYISLFFIHIKKTKKKSRDGLKQDEEKTDHVVASSEVTKMAM